MVPTRRRLLQSLGGLAAVPLAGCAGLEGEPGGDPGREYTLDVDRIDAPLVEYVLYEPGDDPIFGRPARRALDAVLPEGRHTVYGYEPLPENEYVERDGRYYETGIAVTGAKRTERAVVEFRPRDEESEGIPDSSTPVDSLPRADARVAKTLHSYEVTDGKGGASDVVEDGAYVLRRPAEVDGRFATELDGSVVVLGGSWSYRVDVSKRTILEPAYTAFATPIADDRSSFRRIATATRVDSRLSPASLSKPAREALRAAIDGDHYAETEPLSDGFEALLRALGLADVEAKNDLLLLYDGDRYRYGLYVNEP